MIVLLGAVVSAVGVATIAGGFGGTMAAMIAAIVSPSLLTSKSGSSSSGSSSSGLNYSPGNVVRNIGNDLSITGQIASDAYKAGSFTFGLPGKIANEIDVAARDIKEMF